MGTPRVGPVACRALRSVRAPPARSSCAYACPAPWVLSRRPGRGRCGLSFKRPSVKLPVAGPPGRVRADSAAAFEDGHTSAGELCEADVMGIASVQVMHRLYSTAAFFFAGAGIGLLHIGQLPYVAHDAARGARRAGPAGHAGPCASLAVDESSTVDHLLPKSLLRLLKTQDLRKADETVRASRVPSLPQGGCCWTLQPLRGYGRRDRQQRQVLHRTLCAVTLDVSGGTALQATQHIYRHLCVTNCMVALRNTLAVSVDLQTIANQTYPQALPGLQF